MAQFAIQAVEQVSEVVGVPGTKRLPKLAGFTVQPPVHLCTPMAGVLQVTPAQPGIKAAEQAVAQLTPPQPVLQVTQVVAEEQVAQLSGQFTQTRLVNGAVLEQATVCT